MNRVALWMYKVQNQEFGPVTAAELKQLAKSGTITPSDQVRPETLSKWSLASSVRGLFPEVVELVLDDSSDLNEQVDAPAVGPTPLPNPVVGSPPSIVAQRPHDTLPVAKAELYSHSALGLKAQVSEAVWQRLVQLQLPVSDELFWVRLSAFRSRRKEVSPKEAEVKNFWQRASEKISSFAETAEIQTNRFLVVSSDNRLWVTNQLAAVGEAWSLPSEDCRLTCNWNAYELVVNLEPTAPSIEVELAQFKFDMSRDSGSRCYGSPNRIIYLANAGPAELPTEHWTCHPLVSRVKTAKMGSFLNPMDATGRIGIAGVTDSAIVFGNNTNVASLNFANVLAWRKGDGWLLVLYDTGKQLQYVSIVTNGSVSTAEDVRAFVARIDETNLAARDAAEEMIVSTSPEKQAGTPILAVTNGEVEPPVVGVDRRAQPHRALDAIVQTFSRKTSNKFCEKMLLASEFSATPLFGTPRKRLLVICRDNDVQIAIAEPNDSRWETLTVIASHYLRLRETIVRWQRFLVKLEALELRRNEVSATREFLQSIDELTSAINRGASPQEIARMQVDMERAIEKSKAQEEMLDVAMEAAGTSFEGDFPASDGAFAEMERSIAGALGQESRNLTAGHANQRSTAKLDREVGRAIEDLARSSSPRNPAS